MKITKEINPYIFRGYDIRGVYPVDLSEDVAYTIGRSFASWITNLGKDICVIGHDNRYSSEELYNGLKQGILDSGVNVVSLGLVTTPMYYYACLKEGISAGVMVTASHNPKDDNGFKFAFDETGNACGEIIQDFLKFTLAGTFYSGEGKVRELDIKEDYYKYLRSSINLGSRPLKVVLDCGNGTTSNFARRVFENLGFDLEILFEENDPSFPNHHPDPCVEENLAMLKKRVLETNADVGLGFDGDGDRLGVIDELGNFIPMDKYMIMIVKDILPKSDNKKILYDVKCSKALDDVIRSLGGEGICYKTGNSYTKRMTRDAGCVFGGEFSGHVYFRDKFLGFDSGMYAGLRLLEILSNTDKKTSELLEGVPSYYATPEIKIATRDDIKFEVVEKVAEYAKNKNYPLNTIDGVRCDFEDGWALIRASNTGPNITVRFESLTETRLKELHDEFMEVLNTYNQG